MTPNDNSVEIDSHQTFDGIWWSVKLPKGWIGEGEKECATFQRKPPLGALQISSARKCAMPVSDEDLKEFARERISSGLTLAKVCFGPFSGFSTEYKKKRRFWKEWWLRSGKLMVYVTYNVTEGGEKPEKYEIERILETLKPTAR